MISRSSGTPVYQLMEEIVIGFNIHILHHQPGTRLARQDLQRQQGRVPVRCEYWYCSLYQEWGIMEDRGVADAIKIKLKAPKAPGA